MMFFIQHQCQLYQSPPPQAGRPGAKRSDDLGGLKVLPRRWVVESSFGWLMLHCRLVCGYERTISSAENFIYITMIRLQLRRLA